MATRLLPPGRFSTTTGWPQILAWSLSANSRAPMSAPAPGPNGTMNLTGRVGQVCAWSGATASTTATSGMAAAAIRDVIGRMTFLPAFLVWSLAER